MNDPFFYIKFGLRKKNSAVSFMKGAIKIGIIEEERGKKAI